MGIPTWMYHPNQPAKIVDSSQCESLIAAGWFDNPDCKSEIPPELLPPEVPPKENPPVEWKTMFKGKKK